MIVYDKAPDEKKTEEQHIEVIKSYRRRSSKASTLTVDNKYRKPPKEKESDPDKLSPGTQEPNQLSEETICEMLKAARKAAAYRKISRRKKLDEEKLKKQNHKKKHIG